MVRACPMGLPIPLACHHAGNSVLHMQPLYEINEEKRAKIIKANKTVYRVHKTNARCIYADKIVDRKKAVHCDFGEGGEGIPDFAFRPSPYYPRIFSGLGQSGLFSYPIDFYSDNPSARQLFNGVFSTYASNGEINISNTKIIPDPILTDLVKNIVIKDD